MRQGLSQTTQLRQEMKINPRLYQAMDLLYMPLLDLQQHLKQELLNNPFLELVEPDEDEEGPDGESTAVEEPPTEAQQKEEAAAADEIDWEGILLDGFDAGGRREEHEDREYYEPVSVDRRDLADHLRDQIALLELSPRQRVFADEFIGNIADDGYLACPLEEITTSMNEMLVRAAAENADRAAESDDPLDSMDPAESIEGSDDLAPFTVDEAEAMLRVVQGLDPAGVGARDLRECLLLQLVDAERQESVAYRLVHDGFDELINHRWSEISKRFGIAAGVVQCAADEIAKLDPKPGLRYSGSDDGYIIPDLVVEKIDGKYHVFLNDANIPRLKLSRAYQDIARDKKKFDGESKEFISTKLNSANWMIQAIEQRRQTMLKVMNYIVERQRDYFEKGVQGLKPLTLREVAEVISMHESTVSRVTNEKFVQTPRGVLPLKFFFSSGLSTTGGEDVSARGIKAQIEKLVGDEDAKDPLTDQAIVNILKESGVQIARRTVAKYRDQLGVLSRADAEARLSGMAERAHSVPLAMASPLGASPPSLDPEAVDVSVLVPAKDEAENLPLFMELAAKAFAAAAPVRFEVVVVDDGSEDDTWAILQQLRQRYPFLRTARHPIRRGIADALRTGAARATGRVFVFYPADLQYRPEDIPRLVAPILDGESDMVTGYKQGEYEKAFVSGIYNGLSRRLFNVHVRDLNSVKAYKREVMDAIPARPDWHRYMIVVAASQGFTVSEVPIPLYARHAGRTKFGIGRIPVGVLDMLAVWFELRFSKKPLLLFGMLGAGLFGFGFIAGLVAVAWLAVKGQGARWAWSLIQECLTLGSIFFATGILGELIAGQRAEVRELRRILDEERAHRNEADR